MLNPAGFTPSPHILLMEDEVHLAKGLQMVLNEEGYAVDLALNGKTALDTFKGNGYDLLVADLRLPDIDGMEVIEKIREDRPEVKVIVITGYPTVSSAVAALRMGVSDYLPKPFTEDELKRAVKKALEEIIQSYLEGPLTGDKTDRVIEKHEVVRVLERANQDLEFWLDLMDFGSTVLQPYRLSREARAAIVSGDLGWIQEHVGPLSDEQLVWIYKRLEQERW